MGTEYKAHPMHTHYLLSMSLCSVVCARSDRPAFPRQRLRQPLQPGTRMLNCWIGPLRSRCARPSASSRRPFRSSAAQRLWHGSSRVSPKTPVRGDRLLDGPRRWRRQTSTMVGNMLKVHLVAEQQVPAPARGSVVLGPVYRRHIQTRPAQCDIPEW